MEKRGGGDDKNASSANEQIRKPMAVHRYIANVQSGREPPMRNLGSFLVSTRRPKIKAFDDVLRPGLASCVRDIGDCLMRENAEGARAGVTYLSTMLLSAMRVQHVLNMSEADWLDTSGADLRGMPKDPLQAMRAQMALAAVPSCLLRVLCCRFVTYLGDDVDEYKYRRVLPWTCHYWPETYGEYLSRTRGTRANGKSEPATTASERDDDDDDDDDNDNDDDVSKLWQNSSVRRDENDRPSVYHCQENVQRRKATVLTLFKETVTLLRELCCSSSESPDTIFLEALMASPAKPKPGVLRCLMEFLAYDLTIEIPDKLYPESASAQNTSLFSTSIMLIEDILASCDRLLSIKEEIGTNLFCYVGEHLQKSSNENFELFCRLLPHLLVESDEEAGDDSIADARVVSRAREEQHVRMRGESTCDHDTLPASLDGACREHDWDRTRGTRAASMMASTSIMSSSNRAQERKIADENISIILMVPNILSSLLHVLHAGYCREDIVNEPHAGLRRAPSSPSRARFNSMGWQIRDGTDTDMSDSVDDDLSDSDDEDYVLPTPPRDGHFVDELPREEDVPRDLRRQYSTVSPFVSPPPRFAPTSSLDSTRRFDVRVEHGHDLRTTTRSGAACPARYQQLMAHQCEAMFILSSLITSKHRYQVQDALAKVGFANAVDALFGEIKWSRSASSSVNGAHGPHGPGCTCNPESARKIQFLRLIHNFCDRDGDNGDNKNLLLHRNIRLLPRIVDVMISFYDKEPHSIYKYWMSYCVEVFLRGNDREHQNRIAARPDELHTDAKLPIKFNVWGNFTLIRLIVTEILMCGTSEPMMETEMTASTSSTMQIDFDLLGELTKHNPSNLAQVDRALVVDMNQIWGRMEWNEMFPKRFDSTHSDPVCLDGSRQASNKFEVFTKIMMDNLVDSNVFLRSIVLSASKLSSPGYRVTMEERDYILKSRLWKLISENEIQIMLRLMENVKPDDLNQQNVCVVNTLLLMFIFARRRGELAPTLKKIRQASRRKNNELLDFRLVLAVWIEYYVYRSASKFDRTSVSYSSGIDFDEWIETVRDLCGPSSSKTSLEYMGIL